MPVNKRLFATGLMSVLILLVNNSQIAQAQTSQHRQTDLDFVTRLHSQTDQMSARVERLAQRISQLDPAASPMPQTKEHVLLGRQANEPNSREKVAVQSGSGDSKSNRRVPERLRHKDRAVSVKAFNQLQSKLKDIRSDIKNEQRRANTKNFSKNKTKKEQNKRMQRLEDKLRSLESEVAAQFNRS